MISSSLRPVVLLIALTALDSAVALQAQGIRVYLSGQAVPVFTHVDHAPGDTSLGEVRVVQPLVMLDASALDARLRIHATANFEGLTIEDGELAPGDWGEGFVDRRHPHTYVHELLLSAGDLLGRMDGSATVSLSVGKGFVAYGTDDPMSRPALRYPVNHHLSQILERAVAVLGARYGPVMLEGSLFNGDEPERPGQWPKVDRFGDSWALRGTVFPLHGVELQVSRAAVHSPEHRPGLGPDQVKWDLSGRVERDVLGLPMYALVEWARTDEANGFFVYHSFLAEVQARKQRHRWYYRFERTERPEETRLLDLFRSQRPHLDDSIFGITRWTVHTAGYGVSVLRLEGGLSVEPFAEGSLARIKRLSGLFDPQLFYGDDQILSGSIGVRVSWRMQGHRMGRYGVAGPSTEHMGHDE